MAVPHRRTVDRTISLQAMRSAVLILTAAAELHAAAAQLHAAAAALNTTV